MVPADEMPASGAVMVTGAGQIGCLTAALLRRRGDRVLLADVRPPSEAVRRFAGIEDVECVNLDVTDLAALEASCVAHGVSGLIHTAALLSTAIRADPHEGIRVNALGTANVIETGRRRKLRRVVVASSSTITYPVFGSFRGEAIPEDFPMRALSEGPGSLYSATKLFSEHVALLYRRLYGVSVVALRYAAVIGPWPGPVNSVPGRLLETLIAPGESGETAALDDPLLVWEGIEEFVDARDCARANVAALDAPAPELGVYHIASGEALTLDEVIDAVREIHPRLTVSNRVNPKGGFSGFPHPRPARSDIRAAERELGFRPTHDFRDSIRAIAGFRSR